MIDNKDQVDEHQGFESCIPAHSNSSLQDPDPSTEEAPRGVPLTYSSDYLEYLEGCLLSEQEAARLSKKKSFRPRSWVAFKKWVRHHIFDSSKDTPSSNTTTASVGSSLLAADQPSSLLHRNHSTPVLNGRQLRSPSPSPSLPIAYAQVRLPQEWEGYSYHFSPIMCRG